MDLSASKKITVPDFLAGGGQMGELIRAFNWAKTPLGTPNTWPQSLRTTVSLCLASNFPISIAWGPHRVQIYNDGYWPICGDMHPTSMGQDFKECWISAWPVIGQAFEEASLGQTRFLENQRIFLNRFGYVEESFFTFSFSPILDESGGVGGLFHPVIELTQQTLAERRLNVLRAVANCTVNARTVAEASSLILECLKDFERDIPFVLLYSITADGKEVNLQGSVGVERDSPLAPANIKLQVQQSNSWPITEVIQNGKAVHVEELGKIFGTFNCGPYAEPPEQALVFPVNLHGTAQNNYFLVAGVSSRRSIDEKYRLFYELLAASVTNALTRAKAYEEESKKAEALAEIDKAKTVFFSNISHEFRTPLTLMLGSLEELLNKHNGEIAASDKETIETSHRNAMRLLRLVNNLLDFSRLEAGRVQAQYQPTDIAKYTTDLASNFRSVIENAGLTFSIKTNTVIQPVYLDREMWEKIVLNLLSNAFKYTLKGNITISLTSNFPSPRGESLSRQSGRGGGEAGEVVLKVIDTGVGIPETELPKMFQRFHRVQNVVGRTHEGTGIGLSLVSELVKLHGGEISVQSKEGEGSVFTVFIPTGKTHLPAEQIIDKETHPIALGLGTSLAQSFIDEATTLIGQTISENAIETKDDFTTSESSGSAVGGLPTEASAKMGEVVLIVDDNADMRAYIKKLLQKQYNVITANNGMDALHQIKKHSPQLIVSDVMMPIMDGIQLVKAVKENPQTSNIPVILLSARAGENEKIEGFDIGADDYLVKPFSAKELLARVRSQISLAQKCRQVEKQLNTIFKQAPAAIALMEGPHHKYVLANGFYQKLFNRTEEQLIGNTMRQVFPEVEGQGIYELLENVYQTGEPFTANEYPVLFDRLGNGVKCLCYYNFVAQPIKNDEGQTTHILIHAFEITEAIEARKKIEESNQKIRNLIAQAPVAMCLHKGPRFIVEIVNKKMLDIWGKDLETVINKSVFEAMPEAMGQGFEALLKKVYSTGESFSANEISINLLRHGRDEKIYVNLLYEPYRESDGTISGIVEIANEVTDQVLARNKIEQSEKKFGAAILAVEGIIWTNNGIGEMEGEQPGWANLTGQSFEEYQGYGWSSAIHPDDAQPTVDAWNKAVKNKTTFEFEHRVNTKLDGWKLFSVKAVPAIDENGSIQQWVGVHTDISEQREAAQKIKKSESYFRRLTDTVPAIIWITEPDGSCSYLNKLWYDYTGQTEDEAKGFGWLEATHPDDKEQATEIFIKANSAQNPFSILYRLRNSRGEYRWAVDSGSPKFNADGVFEGMIGTVVDVHEEKLAEEKLAYRTALLEAHNQANVDGILLVDAKGKIISYNQKFIEIWNMPRHITQAKDDEAALSFAMTQLVNPQQFIDKVKYLYEHPTETSLDELDFKDGKIVERNGYPVIGEDGSYYAWSWTFRDITVQKNYERNILESENRYRRLFDSSPIAITEEDHTAIYKKIVSLRASGITTDYATYFAAHPEELNEMLSKVQILGVNEGLLDLTGSKDLEDFIANRTKFFVSMTEMTVFNLMDLMRNGGGYFNEETTIKSLSGELKQVIVRMKYPAAPPYHSIAITMLDVTEQKKFEQKIKENEERFRSLANSIPQLAWMTDAEGWIYWYNQRWYDYTGTTLQEMQGWGWQSVHHPDLTDDVTKRFKKAIATGEPYEQTFLLRSKEGEYRWFLTRAVPIKNERGEIVQWFGTNTDVSAQREIQDALKSAKEQLELTFQNVPSAIYHFDKDGKILYLNEIGARQLGYQTVQEVLAEKDVYQLRKRLDETFIMLDEKGGPLPVTGSSVALSFKTGKPSEVVSQLIHRQTGSSFWLLSKSSPLFNQAGELSIVLTTSTDITFQKTSEQTIRQSEERFRTLAETLPQLVWIADAMGGYEYASNQWINYSGLNPHDESTWEKLVHPDDMQAMMNSWTQSIASGETYHAEARLKSKEGEYRWHFVQGEPVRDEEGIIQKWIGAFTDIHEQKTVEEKLEKLVAERTKELQRSNEDLQQFAHVASHDLKEPVRKIRTFGNRLQDEFGDLLPEKASIYLQKIESAATRMYSMIDGVLHYSTLENLESDARKINLAEVLKNIQADLEVLIARKKAVIKYANLDVFEGAPHLIYQLFYNLINNSLKFSREDVPPEITISSKIKKGNDKSGHQHVEITVMDNGIGFNQDQAEKIFKTFIRLNSKDQFEGTGLGLSLSQKIVERHGGSIQATGRVGYGASFIVTLPMKIKNEK